MIRKFAAVPGFSLVASAVFVAILAGIPVVHAQETQSQQPQAQQPSTQEPQTEQPQAQQPSTQEPQQPSSQQPQTQQPANQQPGDQEASPEETARPRKKPKQYKNWTFNVGGGESLTGGSTRDWVRGGGFVGAAGVARNTSKYFGLRFDFQFDNLPLRNQALQAAQAPGATAQVYTFMLDPIINIPASPKWGAYIVFGPSYFHRTGKLDSSTAVPGSPCGGFFTWWGTCYNSSLPLNGKFLSSDENQFGANFGGGITRTVRPNVDVYVEYRFMHGSHSGVKTDIRPITIGIRW